MLEKQSNTEYRKVQAIVNRASFGLVLPKDQVLALGLKAGDFVKVRQEENRIVIEKVTE